MLGAGSGALAKDRVARPIALASNADLCHGLAMETSPAPEPVLYSFRNRQIRESDLAFIRTTIDEHRIRGRSHIARHLCEAWGWRQPSGRLKDMACRDLLLRLEERGFIELPPRIKNSGGAVTLSLDHYSVPVTSCPRESGDLSKVEVSPVASRAERLAWRILVDRFHYLGDGRIPGEHQLYFARLAGEIVGCISWSAAALHCPLRDAHVGWDFETRRNRLQFMANNQRFLILPWVKIKDLGSRILGLNLRRLNADWQQAYGHRLALVETFVDVSRFVGTVYRASNWTYVGTTIGRRRKIGHTYKCEHAGQYAPKAVYLYPLHRRFRETLLGRTP